MLYPSREISTVSPGRVNRAEFNLVWYTPGSSRIPAHFDLLTLARNEIIRTLKMKMEKDSSFRDGSGYDLDSFLHLLDCQFGLVLDTKNPREIIWENTHVSNFRDDEETCRTYMDIMDLCNSESGGSLDSVYAINGVNPRGYITSFDTGKSLKIAHFIFHSMENAEVIRINIVLEPFRWNIYPSSLVKREKWPYSEDVDTDSNGRGRAVKVRERPTLYYMTRFLKNQSDFIE